MHRKWFLRTTSEWMEFTLREQCGAETMAGGVAAIPTVEAGGGLAHWSGSVPRSGSWWWLAVREHISTISCSNLTHRIRALRDDVWAVSALRSSAERKCETPFRCPCLFYGVVTYLNHITLKGWRSVAKAWKRGPSRELTGGGKFPQKLNQSESFSRQTGVQIPPLLLWQLDFAPDHFVLRLISNTGGIWGLDKVMHIWCDSRGWWQWREGFQRTQILFSVAFVDLPAFKSQPLQKQTKKHALHATSGQQQF